MKHWQPEPSRRSDKASLRTAFLEGLLVGLLLAVGIAFMAQAFVPGSGVTL